MSVKNWLKKNKTIVLTYEFLLKNYFRMLTLISPRLNTKMRYKRAFKKTLNLDNPITFSEKLLKLKLERYINNPLVKQCADKYAVREYIKKKGCEDILVKLIASYDRVDDIDFDALPNQFAMKWNFGCGFNIICSDKFKLDIDETKKKMKRWSRSKQYLDYSEMQYKVVKKKIIVEEYLKPKNGLLPEDYKGYYFNGEPKAILYIQDRGAINISAAFFDINWNHLSDIDKDSYNKFLVLPDCPKCLKQMCEISKKLSAEFPFVRLDFYVVNDVLYFGEMTFTPAAGLFASQCLVDGKSMGELLKL